MPQDSNPYDALPYAGGAYANTDPARLRTMAHLFGVSAPELPGARVLELGCGAAQNLLPLACRYPQTRFVGVDLSPRQIDSALARADALGVRNLELIQGDLGELGDRLGTFDYILAHGVWSWVPAPTRDALFALVRGALAPTGVAYISYNVYPGWHLRGAIRDMMLYHAEGVDAPRQRVREARSFLDFLASATQEQGSAFSLMLRQEVALLQQLPDGYLFHDHLAGTNHPVYFRDFVAQAGAAGLAYLGESTLEAMVPLRFSEDVQGVLEGLSTDLVRTEQTLDFLRGRSFRQTLLVHQEVPLTRHLGPELMTDLWFSSTLRPEVSSPDVQDASTSVAFTDGEHSLETSAPLLKAAFLELAEAWPRSLHFSEVLSAARARCGASTPEDARVLGTNLLQCVAQLDLDASCQPWTGVPRSERPRVWSYARDQAALGQTHLVNLRHQNGMSDPLLRAVARLCDGHHTVDDIASSLDALLTEGSLPLSTAQAELATDTRGLVDSALDALTHLSYLDA